MGCVLEGKSPHLKLKHHDKKLAHAAWKPYSKQMKLLADSANQQMVVRKIRKQTGEGFLFAAILSAAIPFDGKSDIKTIFKEGSRALLIIIIRRRLLKQGKKIVAD